MSILSLSALKALFETGDKPTQANFADFIDTVWTIKDLGELTDGASIAVDCESYKQTMAALETAESAVAYTLSNLGKVHDLSVKKNIAGDCTITFSGTGLVFVDHISDPDTESSSLAVTHDEGNGGHKEISLKDSGLTDGSGDKIIYVRY